MRYVRNVQSRLVDDIARMGKGGFICAFNERHEKYEDVLNERVLDKRIKKGTSPYMHLQLRSACFNIKRNRPFSWTLADRPETGLPNINNATEGPFSYLKTKVRARSGIGPDYRRKLQDEYLEIYTSCICSSGTVGNSGKWFTSRTRMLPVSPPKMSR